MAAKKARISFFAGVPKDNPFINIDPNTIHYKEISVFGAFASNRKHFETALKLISTGKLNAKKFVTHTFSLDDIVKGFEITKKAEGLKTVILM